MCGLQHHACTHSCGCCKAEMSKFHEKGEARTVSSLAKDYQNFVDDGAVWKNAKDYNNVVHQPLLFETMEEMLECDSPLVDFFHLLNYTCFLESRTMCLMT